MEKQKRWHLYLILAVIFLTFYNILPTVFYYAHPLKKQIHKEEAFKVEDEIISRVNNLEDFTISWLKSQSKNLNVKPLEISLEKDNPKLVNVSFQKKEDANIFAKSLLKAGALISFVPAEIVPVDIKEVGNTHVVVVQRKIGVHLDPSQKENYFHFIPKRADGAISKTYRTLIEERASKIAEGLAGESDTAKMLLQVSAKLEGNEESLLNLARRIVDMETVFGSNSPLTKRFFASFTQTNQMAKEELVRKFTANLEQYSQNLSQKITKINAESEKAKSEDQYLSPDKLQALTIYQSQKNTVDQAIAIVNKNASLFTNSLPPISAKEIAFVNAAESSTLDIGNRNAFVEALVINWNTESIDLVLHKDISGVLQNTKSEINDLKAEKLQGLLFNAMGSVARLTGESISEGVAHFTVKLNELTNSSSLLVLDLKQIATQEIHTMMDFLNKNWNPRGELSKDQFPISILEKNSTNEKLGLFFVAPVSFEQNNASGFQSKSIYAVLKGFEPLLRKYEGLTDSPEKKAFEEDFAKLASLMHQNGFYGYPGKGSPLGSHYESDYIFELPDAYTYLLAATREDFAVKGDKKAAILEFTDVEQRLLTLNKIETRMHEDLAKWQDEYRAAQLNPQLKYDVPKPTQNVLLSNLNLSTKKYFRGDDRKILKWGLDLSGGKTVRIGLKDQNNQVITSEEDIKEAINELYVRVNSLGVSEVAIRQEGSGILLDFPGSQGLTASELVKASAMYFHVVNEKFTPNNPLLKEAVNAFLDGVWNEAVITNRKDAESVHEIAWQHLGGSYDHPNEFFPITSYAKLLYDNGLRLAPPKGVKRTSAFNDSLSMVAIQRGENFTNWGGQSYPLLIVFNNYALEGSNLADVQTAYDQNEGNILYFGVKNSDVVGGQRINPRDDFAAWTGQYSEEKIAGTPLETYSNGRGWRMAVILNGSIVSAPTLNSALRDSARITGHFSQREINALAADLKAGSLSFTPYILSEENVSPDLGKEQRFQGIMAASVGVILVILAMCICYRFGGFVACVAVLFNLLIIWAVLQNLGAALTLPGIAGIILTVGMAVDANVLVFERIREEFSKHGKIASAIQAGYRRAFSAIIDSNLTTIIAALVLLNFDSGPIKGFAVTLIIGIVSSMFTSLFMTRFFFAGWVQNPAHKELKMMKLFQGTTYDFLKKARPIIIGSILVMVVGVFALFAQKSTIFGMDFTGGYALTFDLQEKPDTNYRLSAEKALLDKGLSSSDFQVRELSRPTQLRLQLSSSLEKPGKPFYKIDEAKTDGDVVFPYQSYPRIVWIVQALESEGLVIAPSSLSTLNLHWSEMSGQLSDTMRTQALIGLAIALLAILVYITFRFEFQYAISATIALVHDVIITLAVLAILHFFYYNIQIDLQVIAALMTIVGYSLNDTIIIFDRIREDLKLYRKLTFKEVVNHALNATLNRTLMTSGTTLLVLLALVFLGGSSIFNFALILTLGVGIGTLSSLFVAAPLLVYFHNRALERHSNKTVTT